MLGALSAAYAVSGVVSIPLWIHASRRYEKKQTWLFAMGMGAAGFTLAYASVLWVGWMFAGLVMAGAGMGRGGMMVVSIMADLVDDLETRTGNRHEGAFTALLNFSLKSDIAVSTALGELMHAGAGFVANQA